MNALPPAEVVKRLEWRYAVKKFDASRAIPDDAWSALERVLVLAPSSFGLQPWRFVVVRDPAVRARLLPASWNQRQVVDASHLVAFALREGTGPDDVRRFLARTAEVRGAPVSSFDGYRDVILRFLAQPGFPVDEWSTRQVYLALGTFMASAAVMGIDTCPMEGIEPAKWDEILGLRGQGYRTVVACAAGYRAADDRAAVAPKVRYPDADVVKRIG